MQTKTKQSIFHKASSRGVADHGWLVSRHTFSFGSYFNPDRINFGALRVLNDDIVQPGMGFGKHPHDNMEIISIPISGSLAHKDSTGQEQQIKTGEVQIMSAGTGIQHSEYNYSQLEAVNFLQIWILPKEKNIAPRYQQMDFSEQLKNNELVTVVSPADENALWINQDATLSLGHLAAGTSTFYRSASGGENLIYAFLIKGMAEINGTTLDERDAVGLEGIKKLPIEIVTDSTLLIIEIPKIY